jgi:hypothetical protein
VVTPNGLRDAFAARILAECNVSAAPIGFVLVTFDDKGETAVASSLTRDLWPSMLEKLAREAQPKGMTAKKE